MVRVELFVVLGCDFGDSQLQVLGVLAFFEFVNLDQHLLEFRLHLFQVHLHFVPVFEVFALFLQLLYQLLVLLLVLFRVSAQSLQPCFGILHLELQLIHRLVLPLLNLEQDLSLILLQRLLHILRRYLLHQPLLALGYLPQSLLLHLFRQVLKPIQLL